MWHLGCTLDATLEGFKRGKESNMEFIVDRITFQVKGYDSGFGSTQLKLVISCANLSAAVKLAALLNSREVAAVQVM
jgi:hypothetical protein